MGFNFGSVNTDKKKDLADILHKQIDKGLEEIFHKYLLTYKSKNYRKSADFEHAINNYNMFMETNKAEAKELYMDNYDLFHFTVVDGKVNIIINPRFSLFEKIGSIDFIANSPVPIKEIVGFMPYNPNRGINNTLGTFTLNRCHKDINDIKEWPHIDAHIIDMEANPKSVTAFNSLLYGVLSHGNILKLSWLYKNNLYMKTEDYLITYNNEVIAKKNSHIMLSDYLYSDTIAEIFGDNYIDHISTSNANYFPKRYDNRMYNF